VDFRLLGSVEAWAGGRPLDVGTRRHRLVLAVLLVEVNRPVPLSRLAALAWEGPPPANAARLLDRLVGELAEVLTPGGAVRVQAGSRTLLTDPLSVDLHRFRALLADAALTGDDRRRSRMLAEALRLSRGPALAGVAPARVRELLCGDVREARLVAAEDRFDAELRLGRHRQVLNQVAAMVRAHPLRERLAGQLVLALYRAGRGAAALRAYHETRQRLADALDRDPGPELRELAAAILHRDALPALMPELAEAAA
jgi:DNA-binding SARP family transcriptional activator